MYLKPTKKKKQNKTKKEENKKEVNMGKNTVAKASES